MEQDRCPVEFKMCLLPVVFTCLTSTHVPAASVVSPGHPSYEGRSLCSRQAALCRGQVGLLVLQLQAAIVFFFIVSFSWAPIMLKPVTVMVEPPSLLDSARSAQSCSFNKIHPGKE